MRVCVCASVCVYEHTNFNGPWIRQHLHPSLLTLPSDRYIMQHIRHIRHILLGRVTKAAVAAAGSCISISSALMREETLLALAQSWLAGVYTLLVIAAKPI